MNTSDTDIFDQAGVNFQEMSQLAKTIAGALGRHQDQQIIDAMMADKGSTVPVGTTGLDLSKLLQAKEAFDAVEAPEEERFMLVDHVGLRQLLANTEISSSDYNTVKALVMGEVDTFLGFNFKRIGTRAEGGLTTNATTTSAIAWHAPAVGYAEAMLQTKVDYVPHKSSYLSVGNIKSGAAGIDPEGIIEVQYDNTK